MSSLIGESRFKEQSRSIITELREKRERATHINVETDLHKIV